MASFNVSLISSHDTTGSLSHHKHLSTVDPLNIDNLCVSPNALENFGQYRQ